LADFRRGCGSIGLPLLKARIMPMRANIGSPLHSMTSRNAPASPADPALPSEAIV
jgi:hypothetical protein